MIARYLLPPVAAAFSIVLSSCGNPGVAVLPKERIHTGASASAQPFAVPGPSESARAAAAGKPRDRHGMPVYSFAERQRVVRTTAYTHTEPDHIQYGNKNAAGTELRYTNRVRSAAADWSFYPVGTTFRIKGLPYLYVVDDYGSALTGTGTVDLYKPTMAVMNQWGLRTVELQVVQWGSFARSATILKDRTRHAHCRQMLANIVRQDPRVASLVAAR